MKKLSEARTIGRHLMASSILGSGVAIFAAGIAVPARADGLPAGGSVVAGIASITANATTATITQSSSRAILNWDSFSVGSGNAVVFNQPGSGAAALNRVTGSTTSAIAGRITSNGAVYLVNPNGIAITATGTVSASGGFVATTLDVANGDFMAGKLVFRGNRASAEVSNSGSITAGQGAYVALLGGSVGNAGTISVPYGRIGLASGEQVTLDLNGNGFMQVAVPVAEVTGNAALINHSGEIYAAGGTVEITAATMRAAVRNIINVSGTINADSATGSAGNITLFGGAGGTVAVSGMLSARATGTAGDGGQVETSGANVDVTGLKVDTSALHGKTGTWLIDPYGLIVDAAAASIISNNLASTSVTVQTNADGSTSGPGTPVTDPYAGASPYPIGAIAIMAPITWGSANAFTVNAYTGIIIGAAITGPNGTLALSAGNGNSSIGTISPNAAVNVGVFQLNRGFWTQSNGAAFGAADFRVNPTNASFRRTVGGDGSAANSFQISDVYGLQGINSSVGRVDPIGGQQPSPLKQNFMLAADIDATATSNWNAGAGFMPIGTDGTNAINTSGSFGSIGFVGNFDGRNHIIQGLTINRPSSYGGLFGYANSNISNVGLVSVNIIGASSGAIVGGMEGGTVTQSYSTGRVAGMTNAGGLVGGGGGTITSAYSSAAVSAATVYGGSNAGGLAGFFNGTITRSYATGAVTGDLTVGGLVGTTSQGSSISQSYASGAVTGNAGTGTSISAGGLVGNAQVTTVAQSHATGSVAVTSSTGRLVVDAGGLVGQAYRGSITRSYATGTVTGSVIDGYIIDAGGLVGYQNGTTEAEVYATGRVNSGFRGFENAAGGLIGNSYAATITSGYWDSYTSGQGTAIGLQLFTTTTSVAAVSSDPAQSAAANYAYKSGAYAGFDFTNTWSPATAAGQMGQTADFYPQLYATTPVILVAAGTASRTYGAANPTIGSITSGGPSIYAFGPKGDTLVLNGLFSAAASATSPVGVYSTAATGANSVTSGGGVAYRAIIASANGSLNVSPAPVTVTYAAVPASRVYGGANPLLSGMQVAAGLVNGDALGAVTSGTAVYTTAATPVSNVGGYAITGAGLAGASGNYSFTFAQAPTNATALTVTPAALTITYTANPLSRYYGGATPALSGTQSAAGLVNGDSLASVTTGTASYAAAATPGSNVGSYAITGAGLVAASANYTEVFVQAARNASALTVAPAPLTVTASAASRLYGAANPVFSYTSSGLVNGDTLSGALATAATTASGVGLYGITQGSLAASANYSLGYTGNNLSITSAPVTVTYAAVPVSRVYGGANPLLSGTQVAAGLVNGDTLGAVTSGTAVYTTAATPVSNVGGYAITGAGLAGASGNYSFTFAQAPTNATALTVTARPLLVSANPVVKQFGAPIPVLSYTVSPTDANTGIVNNDSLTGTLGTPATQFSASGNYPIEQRDLSAGSNYKISYTGAFLKINLQPLQSLNAFLRPVMTNSAADGSRFSQRQSDCTPSQISNTLRASGKFVFTSGKNEELCE